jgi:hypothetical protein
VFTSLPNFKAVLNDTETCQRYETLLEVSGMIFIWLVPVVAVSPARCGRLSSGTAAGWVSIVSCGDYSGKRMDLSDGKSTSEYCIVI